MPDFRYRNTERFNNTKKISISWSMYYYFKFFFIRFNFFIFLCLSIFFLIHFKKNNIYQDGKIKNIIFKISSPHILVLKGFNSCVKFLDDTVFSIFRIRKENKSLQQKNFELQMKNVDYSILQYENQELKNILNYISNKKNINFKILKLNILNKNIFSNRAIVKIDKDFQVKENDLVLNSNGNLIARVVNVNEDQAEILLITDLKSRISGKTEQSNLNVVLSGNGDKYLNINYIDGEYYNLSENENVYVYGDLLYNMSENFPIGKIVKTNNNFRVKININFNQLDYVIVVNER